MGQRCQKYERARGFTVGSERGGRKRTSIPRRFLEKCLQSDVARQLPRLQRSGGLCCCDFLTVGSSKYAVDRPPGVMMPHSRSKVPRRPPAAAKAVSRLRLATVRASLTRGVAHSANFEYICSVVGCSLLDRQEMIVFYVRQLYWRSYADTARFQLLLLLSAR